MVNDFRTIDRMAHIAWLLRPVTYGPKVTATTRFRAYRERRRIVEAAYPLMDEHERQQADAWLMKWEYHKE